MRQRLKVLLLGFAMAIVGLSPAVASAESPRVTKQANGAELLAFKKAIRAQYDLKERLWAAQDYNALVTGFYSPQAFTAAEGEPEFYAQGTDKFLELYKTYVADTTKIRIESVHTYVNGNMGWDWTNFYAEVKPEKVKDYPPSQVRILFVWEKINGKWMCAGDVVLLGTFNTSAKGK